MLTDAQREALKAKIADLSGLHGHLRHCVQRGDDAAAYRAALECQQAEIDLYDWIDEEL